MQERYVLVTCLTLGSLAITSFELLLTRAASVYYYFDIAYLVLATCLAGIGLGALVARPYVERLSVPGLLFAQVALSLALWPWLNVSDLAWLSASFALPFAIFGALSAVTWYRLSAWRGRVRLYVLELLAAIGGLTLAGPLLLSLLPLDVLGAHGVETHLKRLVREESLVAHTSVPSGWAQTDLIQTSRQDVRYVFTDGMFVTRAVAWDGNSPVFREPAIETLATMKRLAFAAAPPGPVALLGAGAGFDIAVALQSGARDIAVVEINPATLSFAAGLDEFAGGVMTHEGVSVHEDDARRFMQRVDKSFSHINITLIQTSPAATRGRHHVDARVLTQEAIRLYLERLAAGGVLTIIQNTDALAAATSRLLQATLAGEQPVYHLRLSGDTDNPFRHLFIVGNPNGDITQLAREFDAERVIHAPGEYRAVTDNRPFFFETGTVFLLQNQLVALACGLVLAVLLVKGRRIRGMVRCQASAALAGAGALVFQMIAVYHVQSIVGLPGLAMAAAIASVLGGAGLGALLFFRRAPNSRNVGIAAAAGILIYTVLAPELPELLATAPVPHALAVIVSITAVCASPLGLPFLTVMSLATKTGARAEAQVIALDGLGGLLGASLGMVMVLLVGYLALGITAALCFVVFAHLVSVQS